MSEIRVIGAGLSGLATAWYLTDAGARVRVLEAGPRPGGLIQTRRTPEGIVETAARAFTLSDRTAALFAASGVTPCFEQPQSKRRFIFRDGRARRWPLSPVESAGLGARVGVAWLGRRLRPRGEESVADWGRRVLGPPATQWLVAPVLQGIYATPPDMLSASAIFGPGRRIRGKLVAPPTGMGELVDRLHQRLVERGAAFEFGAGVDRLELSTPVAVCTSAPAAARLLAPHAPALAAAIANIRMVSLLPVTAFFRPHAEDLRGFGVLFPRASGIAALGVLFNAEMFPGRSDLRSETWIYGDVSAEALPRTEADLRARLEADRRILTGRRDAPIAVHAEARPSQLPIYDAAVLRAQAALGELPAPVALTGNYLGRLGVSSLLESAADSAARLIGAR